MADRYADDGRDHDDDSHEEDEIDPTNYKTIRDAVLFVIDVSQSMLQPTATQDAAIKDKDSATVAALKCAYALMQQRIISHPKDMMGLLLYGTVASKSQPASDSQEVKGCYLFTDLDVPSANDVKSLRAMVQDEGTASKLLVPAEKPPSLGDVMFFASRIFAAKAPNFSSRRLFLVTDNDNPHRHSKDLRSYAVVRAKDLYDLGVIIELFPISSPSHKFDRSTFYDTDNEKDIVYRPLDDPDAPAPLVPVTQASSSGDGLSLLASLLSSVMSRSPTKRALFSNIPLELGPGVSITVKGYLIFKRQTAQRACYIWLEGETPKIATGTMTKQEANSGVTISSDKVTTKKAYKFGGELVILSEQEVEKMRDFGEPGLRLIGFKPLSSLPFWATTRASTFIYPSEEGVVGSTRTFAALQQSLLRKKKYALVWFIARRNATPILAALVAGHEHKDPKTNEQTLPPGLWVCPLPYADDVRDNPELPHLIRAPDVLKDKMSSIISNLLLPGGRYDPNKYPNPSLQWHYRVLQAMALEEDLPDRPTDATIPRYKQINKRVGQAVVEWGLELDKQIKMYQAGNSSRVVPVVPLKREAGASLEQDGRDRDRDRDHKKKSVGTESAIDEREMQKRHQNDTVSKLTLPVLKGWLQERSLPVFGKKDDLVARIEAYFEDKP